MNQERFANNKTIGQNKLLVGQPYRLTIDSHNQNQYIWIKVSLVLFISLIAAMALTFCGKANTNGTVDLKNGIDSLSYYTGIFAASTVKDLDLPELNTEVFYKGVMQVFNQKDFKISKVDADYNIGWHFDKLRKKQGGKNLREGRAFLAQNKTRKGVITTSSGLQYEIITTGNGQRIKENENVILHQKGFLIDGREFVNSYKAGVPDTVRFSKDYILPGYYEAMQLMDLGSKYRIYLPSELGFGINTPPLNGLKPNMAVIFEIEILSVVRSR